MLKYQIQSQMAPQSQVSSGVLSVVQGAGHIVTLGLAEGRPARGAFYAIFEGCLAGHGGVSSCHSWMHIGTCTRSSAPR